MSVRCIRLLITLLLSTGLMVGSALAQSATVLVMGDSLSASYGLSDPDDGWVSLLSDRLATQEIDVVNASISGETTRGGLSRLPDLLERYRPAYVIIALGGNDGLQGQNIGDIRQRVNRLVETVYAAEATPILVGIRIPPNYGPRYTEPFFNLFHEVAASQEIDYFLPFMLEGVAEDPDLMQRDGIHPTTRAQPIILANIWSVLPEELTR